MWIKKKKKKPKLFGFYYFGYASSSLCLFLFLCGSAESTVMEQSVLKTLKLDAIHH